MLFEQVQVPPEQDHGPDDPYAVDPARGQGVGTRFVNEARELSDRTGIPHHFVKVDNPDFFDRFDHWTDIWRHHGKPVYEYNPRQESSATHDRISMALRPEDAQAYIDQYGPYLEHWTRPESVSGIMRRGILPGSHPTEDPPEEEWGDEDYEPPGPEDIRRNWDHFIETRPGYTYLARPGTISPGAHENHLKQRPYQVPIRVDLRKLDHRRLEADEDVARDRWPDWREKLMREHGLDPADPGAEAELDLWDPPDARYWDAESNYNLPQWAEDMGVKKPEWTAESLMHPQGGAIAHYGPIPPEALSLHPDYDYPEAPGGYGQLGLFSKVAAKTRTQKRQEKMRFEREFGPDQAPVFHQFPDGWSLRKLNTPHSEAYEGELQPNCIGSARGLRSYVDSGLYHQPSEYGSPMASLRDPDNLPHASFIHPTESDLVDPRYLTSLDIEGGHGSNAARYVPYIHDYWTKTLGRPALTPGGWDDLQADPMSVGDEQHQAQPANSYPEYRPGGFWNNPQRLEGDAEYGGLSHLKRAVRPIQKAWKRIEAGEDLDTVLGDLQTRLLHNYKPETVKYMLDDVREEHKRWLQYQPYTAEQMEPPGRTEFPEFYWMHSQYGPEAMNAVNQAQDTYRHFAWNAPHMAMDTLDQGLQNVDLLPSDKENLRNAFWDGHARAFAQRSGLQYDPTNSTFTRPMSPEEHYTADLQDWIRQVAELGGQVTAEAMAQKAQELATKYGLGKTASTQFCPTCGDPLKGEFGTYCPRCQWSEHEPKLDHDPLSNPPDPTVNLHRGIQASGKWFAAVEDL